MEEVRGSPEPAEGPSAPPFDSQSLRDVLAHGEPSSLRWVSFRYRDKSRMTVSPHKFFSNHTSEYVP